MLTTAGTSESGSTPARDPLPMPLCRCMAVFIVRFLHTQAGPRAVVDIKSPFHSFTPRLDLCRQLFNKGYLAVGLHDLLSPALSRRSHNPRCAAHHICLRIWVAHRHRGENLCAD